MRPLTLVLVSLLLTFAAIAQPSSPVTATFSTGTPDEAAGAIPFRVTIDNTLPRELVADIYVLVRNNPYGIFIEGFEGQPVMPRIAVAPSGITTYDFRVRFPQGAGRGAIDITVVWRELTLTGGEVAGQRQFDVNMFRRFTVTSATDDGEGSLRRLIQTVNTDPACATLPCSIGFAIPGTATIRVQTPLPVVTASDVELDATTQADTNPAGPDVELLGSALRTGDGLELRTGRAVVRGFAIGGFPGSGIMFRPAVFDSQFTFENNYVGVDPTGTHAVPNGTRGITISDAGVVHNGRIRNNVISGNGRSGIYVDTRRSQFGPGGAVVEITGNRIGVAAASDAAIGNGASGIYTSPTSEWVRVENNVIANNAHMGVALANGGFSHVVIGNRIQRNGGLAIDWGLNGRGGEHDFFSRILGTVIESATYDAAANETVIRGRTRTPQLGFPTFHAFYVSRVPGETDEMLGEVQLLSDAPFTVRFLGDYRGRHVSGIERAWVDLFWMQTSELSPSILVQ